ncbi:MAG: S8 family serine peptidase [Bacteroidia bacterium]
MKRYYALFFLFCIPLFVVAQAPQKYWIQFSDKGNSTYTLANPSAYLSPRALARRTTLGIAIDSLDLPVTPQYVSLLMQVSNITIQARSKWLNGVVIVTNDANALNLIQQFPFVVSTTQVGLRRPGGGETKFDETFSPVDENLRTGNVTSSTLNYGSGFNQINMIGGVCLHNAGFTGQGIQIAVLDAGFYQVDQMDVFDSLWANNRILGTWDFVTGDASVYEDGTHGMHVLSCMGGNLPGQLVGTAPDASYWLLRSEEGATEYLVEEYYWAAAAEFADSVGADVINSSLGYTVFDDPAHNHTYATDMNGNTCPSSRAADYAASRGIVVCVSAGNSGSSAWFYISAPADADSILAVGAVDPSGAYASFSSRGPSADNDVKPNVAAQGQATVVAAVGGGIQTGNGTSFASPVLCGLMACLRQAHPTMPTMQLVNTIQQTGDQYASPDTYLGNGKPDFCAANLTLNGNPDQLKDVDTLFDLSPNPFADELNFSFWSVEDQNLYVSLYDLQGRLIMQQTVFATGNAVSYFTINELTGLAKGMYVIHIEGNSMHRTEKIVKR